MKKSIILLFVVIILITGCTKTEEEEEVKNLTCTYYDTREGNKYNTEVKIDLDNNIVTNATATITYDDEELASQMCEIYKIAGDIDLTCNSKVITMNDYQKSIATSLGKDELTKDDIVKYFEDQSYDCE
jgi:uncharacterized lipoprotein NlpE involved in copper resistance